MRDRPVHPKLRAPQRLQRLTGFQIPRHLGLRLAHAVDGDIEYLPEKNQVEEGHIVYTSGADGIISPGIPIGKIKIKNSKKFVKFFADFDQIKYVKVYFKK